MTMPWYLKRERTQKNGQKEDYMSKQPAPIQKSPEKRQKKGNRLEPDEFSFTKRRGLTRHRIKRRVGEAR